MSYMIMNVQKENVSPNWFSCGCNFYDSFDSAKAAFDSIENSALCIATLVDCTNYKELIGKEIDNCGVVHIWERTV